jgi:hypothetical protein
VLVQHEIALLVVPAAEPEERCECSCRHAAPDFHRELDTCLPRRREQHHSVPGELFDERSQQRGLAGTSRPDQYGQRRGIQFSKSSRLLDPSPVLRFIIGGIRRERGVDQRARVGELGETPSAPHLRDLRPDDVGDELEPGELEPRLATSQFDADDRPRIAAPQRRAVQIEGLKRPHR